MLEEMLLIEEELGRQIDGLDEFPWNEINSLKSLWTVSQSKIVKTFTRDEILSGRLCYGRSSYLVFWFIDDDGLKKYVEVA